MANMKTKDINFYSQFEDPSKKKNNIELILIIVFGIIVIGLAGTYAFLFMTASNLQSEVDMMTAQTQDQTLLDRIKSSDEMAAETTKINALLSVYYANDAAIAEKDTIKDKINDILLMRIIECQNSEVEISSFSYSDNTVTLTVEAKSEKEAASYAKRLRESQTFDWVDYTGFTGSEGSYTYSLVATFETTESETEASN